MDIACKIKDIFFNRQNKNQKPLKKIGGKISIPILSAAQ